MGRVGVSEPAPQSLHATWIEVNHDKVKKPSTHPLEQGAGCGFQGKRETHNVVQADVALASLNGADICPMKSSAFGQLFLRPFELEPKLPNVLPERGAAVWFSHGRIMLMMMPLRLQTISSAPAYPFAAVVGLELAKQALLLLAVEPRLKGVLIAAGPGTAKSTMARAYPFIFPPSNDPSEQQSAISNQRMPYIELPLGATEDRVLGGLDLELTLATGARQLKPGLLAEAHGGILYIDSINLLETSIANHLSGALSEGQIVLEREGLSGVCAADFMLVGTYDPAEGEVNASLHDRVGLLVTEGASPSADERAEIVRRVADYSRDPVGFIEEYAEATAILRKRIAEARDRLPAVQVTMEVQQCLALAALQLGVEGNRADIFALRAARANAAIEGRDHVEADDVEMALQLVLAPRALFIPTPEEEREAQSQPPSEHQPPSDSAAEDQTSESPNPPPPTPSDPQKQKTQAGPVAPRFARHASPLPTPLCGWEPRRDIQSSARALRQKCDGAAR